VPSGEDSRYRITATTDDITYGTGLFSMEKQAGTKVLFHLYPITKNTNTALFAGETSVFLEPRDDVISIEYFHRFHNLGRTVLAAESFSLHLPNRWKAFSTNPIDPDLSVKAVDDGVSLVGAIAPGQHAVMFAFQIPNSNRDRLRLELDLLPNTANVQVATFPRPGLALDVDGFPRATVNQRNGRRSLLTTERAFANDSAPPEALRLDLSGLPVVGWGRWVATLAALAMASAAILRTLLTPKSAAPGDVRVAAKKRIVDELAALEVAHRRGDLGETAFQDTREILLAAFVRLERES